MLISRFSPVSMVPSAIGPVFSGRQKTKPAEKSGDTVEISEKSAIGAAAKQFKTALEPLFKNDPDKKQRFLIAFNRVVLEATRRASESGSQNTLRDMAAHMGAGLMDDAELKRLIPAEKHGLLVQLAEAIEQNPEIISEFCKPVRDSKGQAQQIAALTEIYRSRYPQASPDLLEDLAILLIVNPELFTAVLTQEKLLKAGTDPIRAVETAFAHIPPHVLQKYGVIALELISNPASGSPSKVLN